MLRTASVRLATILSAAALTLIPSLLHAQKALVYCPVGIDAAGCNAIVAALAADAARFPDGADAGYDGTQGTVDLAGGDLGGYAVFVVPSLADGPDAQPYALLRNGTIAARLQAAFMGRVAVWSGTPDVGSTNRGAKDELIRNLAAWAKADAAGSHGPGVVALQDNSDDEAARYGWLGGISVLSASADPNLEVYSNVQVLTSTGAAILTNGSGLQIGYTNMASFGVVGTGANARNDATGGRSTRVVLLTAAGEPSDPTAATVSTDKEDYPPGETVIVTGTGWEPGETVTMVIHEDPLVHGDRSLTAVADENGQIYNADFHTEETDLGVRFTLVATGQTSGRTAQVTFTDDRVITAAKVNGAATTTVPAGGTVTAAVTVTASTGGAGGENWFSTAYRYATTPPGTTTCEDGTPDFTAVGSETATFSTMAPTTPGTYNAYFIAYRTANCGNNASNTFVLPNALVVTAAPDLTVNKSHTGNFTVGVPATYTITVTNSGSAATTGTVTVTDVQPSGLSFTGATGTGWTCSGTSTISCNRSNALAAGSSYPDITVNVNPTSPGTVTNVASVTGGGQANTTNDSDSDPTTVVNGPDLTVNKTHAGNFSLGVNGVYTLTVSNGGGSATTGTVTLTDVLPSGLGFVSATGTGWTCGNTAGTVTCTRTTAINNGAAAPAVTLTVSVAEAAFPSVTNTASVSGGGEPAANAGNNSDSDLTTVLAPDLAISKSHTGNFTLGVNGVYTLTASNGGGAATTGTVTVTDALPAGLGFVSAAGTGWTCGFATGTVTCTRTTAINAGNSAPNITLTVSVAEAAFPSVTNTASVSGGGEPAANNTNNSDSDLTTVVAPNLAIDKSHTGSFTAGINGVYALAVSNTGGAATTGTVTVTDVLPTGLGFVSAAGTAWTCGNAAGTVTCTRTTAIAAGGAAPNITLTVSVAAAAIPSVTNTASVSGGGEPAANNGNNSDSDLTTVAAGVDLTIDKSHTGNFTETVNGVYTLAVSNAGGTATSANVTVTDVLPTGLGFVSGTGTGWTNCTAAAQTVTCVRPAANTIAGGATAPGITLTVSVGAAAVPSVTNTASVAGGGEPAANNGNNSDSDPTTVIASNQAPLVDAGGPYTGAEGSAIALAGASATDPDAGDTPTYKWTYVANGAVDAGTTCSFSNDAIVQPSFTCNDDGAFTLTLTVNDGHGHVVADNAAVTVTNVKPTATAGGPYTGDEGSAIQLAGTGDDPAANDDDPKLTYKWTVTTTGIDAGGACSFDDDTKKNAKITCTDDGAFSVSLVATDDDGAASDAATADLTVANVKPVADAGGPYTGDEGTAVLLAGSATDVGANDTRTYLWTADVTGIDAGGACTFDDATKTDAKVTCTDDGTFKVKLVATDDDGGASTAAEATLTVANADPVAEAGGPYDGNEGEAIQLNGSVTDAGSNDTHTWSWEYLSGPGLDVGATCSFTSATAEDPKITCTDDGEVKLTLTVTDDNGGTGVDEATLTLANVKPVANAGGPYTGEEGASIPLDGSATDAGTNDVLSYQWTAITTGIDAGGACTFDDATKKNAAVTCTDDGAFKVKLVATDDDGAASTAVEATLTVANADPVADAGGPYDGNEGSAIQLNGSVTDAGSNDTHTWSWEYVSGPGLDAGATCSFTSATAEDPKITCTDDGQVELTLTVTDDNGGTGVDQATLTLANVPPVAHAGGPYTGDEGSAVLLAGSATDVAANDVISYKWTANTSGLDAGATCAFDDDTKADAKVTCTDDGTVQLTLKATDDDGGMDTDQATLTVTNAPPVASAGGPYTGNEGAPVQLSGSQTDAGSNDTHVWSWQYVAGAGVDAGATCSFDDATAVSPKITCTDDGEIKLTLTVTDDDGDSGNDEAILTLANVAPTAHAGGTYSGNEGTAVLLNGSATDPASNDVITYKWTADVSGLDAGGSCSFDDATKKNAQVTCTDDGTVTLTLEAKDDDGDLDTDAATLTLANVDPVANAGGPYTGNEGAAVQLNGSVTDDGANDTHQWSWQYIAGPGVDAGATCSFTDATAEDPKVTCTDDGEVKLTLKAKDDDGGEGTAEAILTLANVAPTALAGGPYTGSEGGAVTLNGSQTDPGSNDSFSYKWTVNASGIDAGGVCGFDDDTKKNAKVTCTDDGAFTLTLAVTDDDGETGTQQTAFTVQNANPVAVSGGPYTGAEGAFISLAGSASDAGSNDTRTYLWTVNAGAIDASGACTFDDATKLNAKVKCTDDSNGGSFTLTLAATDDDAGVGTSSTTLVVTNIKPTIATLTKPDGTALPATLAVAGTLNIKVPFTDPASNDTHKAEIDCGTGYVNVNGGLNVTTGFLTSCTFATVGTKVISVRVTDDDNLADVATHTLTIKYNFDGFYAPVDRPNTMNLSKAGQAIPLKWRLTDALGNPVENLTAITIRVKDQSCSLGTTTDQIEEYAAGESGLKYQGDGKYQFTWKTPASYLNSCKSIELVYGAGALSYVDGPFAYFSFKK